ncbi:MAG: aldo/keto reductase [Rhizobiaceae bacterium]|nr:aldo/keto reductase [Rhizobiaceae bacterium]
MERVKMGEIELSRIVYGMWRVGDDKDTSPKHIRAKIDACLEQGITTIDQADIYGGYTAEGLLGAAFREAPSLRDRVEIVTKCGILVSAGRYSGATVKHYDTTRAHIEASIDHSLREMAVERIDLLLVHRPDPLIDHRETGAALDEAVASGKVRAVGVSNFRPWDFSLLQSAMEQPLVTNQIELSLLTHEPFVNGDLAFLQEHEVTPMAWSPLGGGRLVKNPPAVLKSALDKEAAAQCVDPASVAVAWLLAHPAGIAPVMGTNDLSRIRRFSEALRVEMDRECWYRLYTAALGREVA